MLIRLLIVLADTGGSDLNNNALSLHRGLHREGFEVRTIALAPAPHGGLDEVVPVLAPTTRSLASVMQLRREQRWADVIICAGAAAMFVQRLTGSRKNRPVFELDSGSGVDPGAWKAVLLASVESGSSNSASGE